MRSLNRIAALALLAALLAPPPASARNENAPANEIAVAALPREAQQTLQSIKRGGPFGFERDGVVFGNYERRLPARQTYDLILAGGPFPYPKDGAVFGNREGLLPQHARGYYREYTVPTPGVRNRGARRIVAGANAEYYYSDDHYRSFRRIRE